MAVSIDGCNKDGIALLQREDERESQLISCLGRLGLPHVLLLEGTSSILTKSNLSSENVKKMANSPPFRHFEQ